MKYLCLGLCLVFAFDLAFWNTRPWFRKNLSVTFLDVGQGDAIFLEFPSGKRMLIDGGGLQEDRFDIGKNVIAPFFWKKKVRKIDILVLTHPDPDHLKGLNFIASHFSIDQFWDNGLHGDSESYHRLRETFLRKKVKQSSLNEQTPQQIIHGVQLSILNPPVRRVPQEINQNSSYLNNQSLVMKIQFKNIGLLLTGDIEKEAEYRMVRKGLPIKADLLKIPHHGSVSSSTLAFLDKVRPSYAILSMSERNTRKLPHPEVLRRYERLDTRIFRTDRHGAITVITDGEKIEIKTFLE